MTNPKSVTLHQELIEFVNHQTQLLTSLHNEYPILKLFELPRNFEMTSHGNLWNCRRHGAGIWFSNKSNGVVIDAHKNIESYATFDAWRISTFLESKKIIKFHVFNAGFGTTEREVETALMILADMNVVKTDPATRLLKLAKNSKS